MPQSIPHWRGCFHQALHSPTGGRQKYWLFQIRGRTSPVTGRHCSCEKSLNNSGLWRSGSPNSYLKQGCAEHLSRRAPKRGQTAPWEQTGSEGKHLRGELLQALRKLLVTIYKWLATDEKLSELASQLNSAPPQLCCINHSAGWLYLSTSIKDTT